MAKSPFPETIYRNERVRREFDELGARMTHKLAGVLGDLVRIYADSQTMRSDGPTEDDERLIRERDIQRKLSKRASLRGDDEAHWDYLNCEKSLHAELSRRDVERRILKPGGHHIVIRLATMRDELVYGPALFSDHPKAPNGKRRRMIPIPLIVFAIGETINEITMSRISEDMRANITITILQCCGQVSPSYNTLSAIESVKAAFRRGRSEPRTHIARGIPVE